MQRRSYGGRINSETGHMKAVLMQRQVIWQHRDRSYGGTETGHMAAQLMQ